MVVVEEWMCYWSFFFAFHDVSRRRKAESEGGSRESSPRCPQPEAMPEHIRSAERAQRCLAASLYGIHARYTSTKTTSEIVPNIGIWGWLGWAIAGRDLAVQRERDYICVLLMRCLVGVSFTPDLLVRVESPQTQGRVGSCASVCLPSCATCLVENVPLSDRRQAKRPLSHHPDAFCLVAFCALETGLGAPRP